MAGKGSICLSLSEREIIKKMIDLGCKTGAIAGALERSHSCVKQEISKNGGRASYCPKRAHSIYLARFEARVLKMSHGFSKEEEEKIKKMVEDGVSLNRISNELKCSSYSIRSFLKRSKIGIKTSYWKNVNERINELEYNFKFLSELIKELYENSRKN